MVCLFLFLQECFITRPQNELPEGPLIAVYERAHTFKQQNNTTRQGQSRSLPVPRTKVYLVLSLPKS